MCFSQRRRLLIFPFTFPSFGGRVILYSPFNGIFLLSNTQGVFAL
uniref:Uncharacterized protein n=1 Tax=Rhizophora mucronata TaxID=61149 RepID=A0A2P2J0E7_RHIMU